MSAIIASYSYEDSSRAVIVVKQQYQVHTIFDKIEVINQAKQITDILRNGFQNFQNQWPVIFFSQYILDCKDKDQNGLVSFALSEHQ